ncbi:HCP-like protein [Sodiomyces alkalinus F11]|uniref:HCP-like protein n=1 Tax=Sodiomyces alkalinus (strain CBS 110278 / VKM F-3762 / F11) TaxID=1314773 RepID=A0A3N2PTP2_SODAK|nr:HCP-like protein [Sodiomyces alkalinus F11]ROT37872.1 HCP-like protein [Sodiomyces alkalinus F11]
MPQFAATFVPSGTDDYYMPEVVAPAPQRVTPQVPQNMQDDLQRMELEARGNTSRPAANADDITSPTSVYSDQFEGQSRSSTLATNSSKGDSTPTMASSSDAPSFSPFPRVKGDNIPPSDDEKEEILWNAREHVLHSNNVSMQLAWARDTLAWIDIVQEAAARNSDGQPRPQTPHVEHTLRVDAINIVEYLASQEHPEALFMKAKWHEFGKFGVRQDKKEAYAGYKRAAGLGYGRAEYRMGMLFESSNDFNKAIEHYFVGLRSKDSAAAYRLGMMSLLGQHGQPKDFQRGLQLINEAADTADEDAPQGAYVFGLLLSRELPEISVPDAFLPVDLAMAKMYLEKAAYLGFAKAQLKMGQAYELCQLGCDFNPAYSIHYYGLAAKQGQPEASLGVSRWFLFGYEGVFHKNEQLAFKYAREAAAAKLPTGEFAMGYYHEIGISVSKDLRQAAYWYELAAEHGNKDAVGRLESLKDSKSLTKKDHETTTLTRIKSTHGSQRGKRPERLKQSKAMPTLTESGPTTPVDRQPSPRVSPHPSPRHQPTVVQDNVHLPDPSRASVQGRPAFGLNVEANLAVRPKSAAPYPQDDRPAPLHGGRSQSTAPYPEDDVASGRGGLRPYGPQADRPSSAFGIRPLSSGGGGNGRGPYPNDGVRPSQSMANLAPTGPDPRGRMSQGPGGYRQPSPGPGYPRQDVPRPATAQPYAGPGGPGGPAGHPASNKLQKPGPGGYGRPHPGGPGPHGPGPGPGYGQPPRESAQSTPPGQPGRDYGPRPGSRPGPGPGPGPGHGPGPGPGLPSSVRPDRYDSMPASTGPRPASARPEPVVGPGRMNSAPPSGQPPPKPGKQGPSTFEEMGIPQGKADDQCVSALARLRCL